MLSRHVRGAARCIGTPEVSLISLQINCFATKGEMLQDSLSDAFYDVSTGKGEPPASSTDRPLSRDARVRRARSEHAAHLSDRGAGVLHDSMSEGLYPYRRRSSVADPEYFLNSSLSEGDYQMPSTLRAASRSMRPRQVFRSAGPASLPMMQRVVQNFRPTSQPNPLHNSYSHGDYFDGK